MKIWMGLCLVALCCGAALGCSEDGTEVARECVKSNLIEQCPPGSEPRLDAASSSECAASGEANLITRDGSVTGFCVGEGTCSVLCQFAVPCRCGVESITDEGVQCVEPCTDAACGNGTCEPGENADSCAIDCGAVCEPGMERCNGNNREICNLAGRFDTVACPDGQQCGVDPGDGSRTVCVPAGG